MGGIITPPITIVHRRDSLKKTVNPAAKQKSLSRNWERPIQNDYLISYDMLTETVMVN